jgi:ABC-2 type transport system permease protein
VSGIWTVCERELRSLFRRPIAWVILAFFLFAHGLFFVQLVEQYSELSRQALATGQHLDQLNLIDRISRSLLVGDTFLFLFLLPALSMRQLAEEVSSGTWSLLSSYPLRERDIVLGKFLASAAVMLAMVALGAAEMLALRGWAPLEIDVVLLGAGGLALYGFSVLALGMVFSAWSENQLLAFAATLIAQLLLLLVGFWGVRAQPPFDSVLGYLNFTAHVSTFSFGLWRASSTFFFVGLSAFYLYCATALLARRRWHEGA